MYPTINYKIYNSLRTEKLKTFYQGKSGGSNTAFSQLQESSTCTLRGNLSEAKALRKFLAYVKEEIRTHVRGVSDRFLQAKVI